jgi:SNF2 family DNA or RNA helicase
MKILHLNWSRGFLHAWGESSDLWAAPATGGGGHPWAIDDAMLRESLAGLAPEDAPIADLSLRLPALGGVPLPSARLAHEVGHAATEVGDDAGIVLSTFVVRAIQVGPADAPAFLDRLSDRFESGSDHRPAGLARTDSVTFFVSALRLVRHVLAQQRFVPMLRQDSRGEARGCWQPWLADERTAERAAAVCRTMPPAVRAVVDPFGHEPWAILEDFLGAVADAQCRAALLPEDMFGAVREKDLADPHVAWLSSILGSSSAVAAGIAEKSELVKGVRRWIAGLEDRGASSAWRLCLTLSEPGEAAALPDLQAPGDELLWRLDFGLRSVDDPDLEVSAADVWLLPSESVTIGGRRLDSPQELLLAELGRASRLYPKLEASLSEPEPVAIELTTRQAYQFLRETAPILAEQGFGVEAPVWWDQPTVRLGARLHLDSDPVSALMGVGGGMAGAARPQIGLSNLVGYRWEISIGGASLTLKEFEQLAAKRSPLLKIGGQWVEVRPEDVRAAIDFIRDNPGGKMRVVDAVRMAYASDARQTGIPIVGLEATGWVAAIFGDARTNELLPMLEQPKSFQGTLRPYQARGMSWMTFLERFGLGPCLADDMGLGKTIQLLALLALEREEAAARRAAGEPEHLTKVLPTLLVVPMSVVGNWMHEAKRFCPHLKLLIHHGLDRLTGDAFVAAAEGADAIITTYALCHRDREMIQRVTWGRIVLDEAQFIKNPAAKQAQSVRSIPAERRVALTGTPVENRLSELWSIIDFLNPGYLGPAATFRKRFGVPIERYKDQARSRHLRGLVQPFILRRLKTDPTVATDLPSKVESREYCSLTTEQAALYESTVKRMLGQIDRSEGIQRRGLVLAALIRLKQICNHPAQMLKDHDFGGTLTPQPARSGKCVRLLEMLEEVMANDEQSLVFTQFRQMGHLLISMLVHHFDREVLFLHGGTPQKQRDQIVQQFQKSDGSAPILVASLKAGGVGLNLTAATHVFHFDRWWNPAVENQATDRAYRIGQTRNVQVHKFVVSGTLEERIDEMIESKTELAEQIIGAGERWLTELDTGTLRDLLTLRRDAVAADVDVEP